MKMKKIVSLLAFVFLFAAFAGDAVTIKETHSIPPLSGDQLDIVFLVDTSPSLGEHINFQKGKEFVFGILNDLTEKEVDYNAAFVNLDATDESHFIINQNFSHIEIQQHMIDFYRNSVGNMGGSHEENSLYSLSVFFATNPSFLRPDTRLALIVLTDEKEQSRELVERDEANRDHDEANRHYFMPPMRLLDARLYPGGFCHGANANICEMVRTPGAFLETMFKSRREGGFARTRGAVRFYVVTDFEAEDVRWRYLALTSPTRGAS